MLRRIRKPCELKVISIQSVWLVLINIWLFPGSKASNKIREMELTKVLLYSMTNVQSRQAYVHGFDIKGVTFKKTINKFDILEIYGNIYEGILGNF